MINLQMSVRLKDCGREVYFRSVTRVSFDGEFLEVLTVDCDGLVQQTRIAAQKIDSYAWHFHTR